jgi:L-asparaginase II
VVCKRGAEGVFCCGLRGRGIGFAIKIADGSARPVPPLVARLLEKWLPGVPLDELKRRVLGPLTNTRGEIVGELAVQM